MNLVIMFKNQTDFRGDNTTDLKMLKISIKQWNKFYKPGIGNTYICGSYSEPEAKDIIHTLGNKFIDEYNIKILNVGKIPDGFNTSKTNILNYQMITAWDYLKDDFIFGVNDIFPIKFIDNTYINKEYAIRYKDYTKVNSNSWIDNNWINTIKYFKSKYGFESKEVYEGHIPYMITKEFMDFYLADKSLWFNKDRNIVLTLWLKMNGYDILHKEKYCKMTFANNKLQTTRKDLKALKMINVTLPNHPESKKLLKRIIK